MNNLDYRVHSMYEEVPVFEDAASRGMRFRKTGGLGYGMSRGFRCVSGIVGFGLDIVDRGLGERDQSIFN